MISIDFSKKQATADPKVIRHIDFTENLYHATTMFVIIKEAKKSNSIFLIKT